MATQILMPALSPTMEEGTLANWLVKEGDTVSSGDILAEIETDKATMEFEAVDEGIVGKIIVAEGTEGVKVNVPIAVLLEDGESADDISASPAPAASAPAPTAEEAPTAAAAPAAAPAPAAPAAADGARIFASPLARRNMSAGSWPARARRMRCCASSRRWWAKRTSLAAWISRRDRKGDWAKTGSPKLSKLARGRFVRGWPSLCWAR